MSDRTRVLRLRPTSFAEAKEFIAEYHRHNAPPQGWKFGTAVETEDGERVGVAMAGRPVARHLDDGRTLEVIRTCTDGTRNANSMLYGAIRRMAEAAGYWRLVTYTLASESGSSLKATGWKPDEELAPRSGWDTPSRPRDDDDKPTDIGKVRWVLWLDREAWEAAQAEEGAA